MGKPHLQHKQKEDNVSHQTEALSLVGLMCYFLSFSTNFVPKPLCHNSFHSHRLMRKEIDIPNQPMPLE